MKGHEQSIDYLKSACSKDVMAAGSVWEIMTLTAIHPGEHLAEELKALDMSAAELARKINVPANRVTQILKGTRSVTGDTTLRLAHFFGTSAEFWLNVQSLYQLRLAQQKIGKSIEALPTLRRPER